MSRGWPAVGWYCWAPIFTWKRRFIIIAAAAESRRRRENGSTAFTNYHPPFRVICHEAITNKKEETFFILFFNIFRKVFFIFFLSFQNRIKSKQCGDGTKNVRSSRDTSPPHRAHERRSNAPSRSNRLGPTLNCIFSSSSPILLLLCSVFLQSVAG
jgi:hypothetical protein